MVLVAQCLKAPLLNAGLIIRVGDNGNPTYGKFQPYQDPRAHVRSATHSLTSATSEIDMD